MTMTARPLLFEPGMENPSADEVETIQAIKEVLHSILETTSGDYGIAVRAVHAKAHGLVRGSLEIRSDLPAHLAQGLFATAGAHDAILRFSTNPSDMLDDLISVPRGMAIKVMDVRGERLPGSREAHTQDFLMANGPAFGAANPKAFLSMLSLLAHTTDRGEALKKLLSMLLGTTQTMLHAIGQDSRTLARIGGAPNLHPLGATYYSQTPYLHGGHVAKYSLEPASDELRELAGMKINAHGRPDALREDIAETLVEHGGVWHLRAQLCTDLATMPIEDASIVWDTESSPFETVGTLSVPPQASWIHGTSDQLDQKLAFSPWNGLAAHRPLGAVNRARQPAYEMSSGFRAQYNGCPLHEPQAAAALFA